MHSQAIQESEMFIQSFLCHGINRTSVAESRMNKLIGSMKDHNLIMKAEIIKIYCFIALNTWYVSY